jgi:hypothetical protein
MTSSATIVGASGTLSCATAPTINKVDKNAIAMSVRDNFEIQPLLLEEMKRGSETYK